MSDAIHSIRVLVVDDDPFVRASLVTILSAQPDIEVCGEGANGNEALELFGSLSPDIVLMDIQMSECSGLEAAQKILLTSAQARIVFLTTFADDEYIVSALRLGVKGYLIKQEVAQIAPALRSVLAGQMVLGGEVVGKVDALVGVEPTPSSAFEPNEDVIRKSGLSEREYEIVTLVAQGFDNKEIAGKVYISEGTVRNHVSVILQKLGLKNRTQIAVYYYQAMGFRN